MKKSINKFGTKEIMNSKNVIGGNDPGKSKHLVLILDTKEEMV